VAMAAAAPIAPHICHLKTLGHVIRGPEHMHSQIRNSEQPVH